MAGLLDAKEATQEATHSEMPVESDTMSSGRVLADPPQLPAEPGAEPPQLTEGVGAKMYEPAGTTTNYITFADNRGFRTVALSQRHVALTRTIIFLQRFVT